MTTKLLVYCALTLLVVGACAPMPESNDRPGLRQSVVSNLNTSMMGTLARVSIRLTDPVANVQEALAGRVPRDDELLWATDQAGRNTEPYVVQRQVLISGTRVERAAAGFDPRNDREPVVYIMLDERGARALADITRQNVNRVLVIVLDDKVISAPVIREPILGGALQISGNFTVEMARTVAALLNSNGEFMER